MKGEVLHVRDPDYPCEVIVFIDGVGPVLGVQVQNVDPGAGHELEEWDDTTEEISKDESLSPGFRDAVVAARNAARGSQYIT